MGAADFAWADGLRTRDLALGGLLVGLSLNPSTPIDAIVPFMDLLDVILLLAIGPDTGSSNFIARTTAYSEVKTNQTIEIVFDMKKSHIFDKDTDKTIV